MKPAQASAHNERMAQRKLFQYGQQIPDNKILGKILRELGELPLQQNFYSKIKKALRFKPLPLKELLHVDG